MTDTKEYTRAEVSSRNTKNDAFLIIDNKVYDVTKFLDDHPGGHEVLMNAAGKDASEEFDDVGHSLDAKELLEKFYVGELVAEERVEIKKKTFTWDDNNATTETESTSFLNSWKFPVVLGLIMTVIYSYLFG